MVRVAGNSDAIKPCLLLFLRDSMDHGIYQHLVAVILGGWGMVLGGRLLTRVQMLTRGGVAMTRMMSVPVSSSLVMRRSSVLLVIVTLMEFMAPLSAPVLSRSGEGGRGPSIVHISPIPGPVVPDFF